jgi:hypothetical protein
MRTDTGNCRVVNVNNGTERMRPLLELFEQAFAADPCKADARMNRAEHAGPKPRFHKRGAASFFNFGKRAVHANAQSSRAGDACPQQASLIVFDARAAAAAATVNADKQESGL